MNPMLPAALQQDLVLASGSPRRAEILSMLGFEFETVLAPIAEEELGTDDPTLRVQQLAALKAQAARRVRPRGILIAADTTVVVDGGRLEKPSSPAEALAMQHRLRGRWHTVLTGVAVLDAATGAERVGLESTDVHFESWDDEFLRRYVETGEGMDKAGGYAIQGLGALLVREIRGCYFNVMGFPIGRFVRLLSALRGLEVERAG
jgi:septum formation protein